MAHVTTHANGVRTVVCPKCGRTRAVESFRGNPEESSKGWFKSCEYCRAKNEFVTLLGKPEGANWDDVGYDPCPFCGGDGRYLGSFEGKLKDMGPCYRCKGKGKQTWRDAGRNMAYDS